MTSQPNETTTARPIRADGITIIAIYFYLGAGLFLLGTLGAMIPTVILAIVGITEEAGALIGMAAVGLVAMTSMALSLLHLVVGYGLWLMRPWARIGAIALAIVGLLFAPIGTVVGAFILWYLLKPDVSAQFEAKPAA
jgi:uncharacterized membrane protein YqjE